MKNINHNQIVIPLEFNVACAIYKIKVADVLQVFINHVTLFDSISSSYQEGYSEASHAIISYIRSKESTLMPSKSMQNCSSLFSHHISEVIILAKMKKRGWSATTKRKRACIFVSEIFNSMQREFTSSDLLYLDEFSTLKLSADFCVICEVYNCYPKEYLEYVMGKISLADAHAHRGLRMVYDNYIFKLFFKIAHGLGRNVTSMLNLSNVELDFYERMEELRLELYIIRDLNERAAILRDFYLSHYKTMNLN